MKYALLIAVAVLAGAILPIQASMNAKLGRAVGDPVYAALISFVIGTVGLIAYVLFAKTELQEITKVSSLEWYIWTAGLMGAFYVAAVIILVPKIGATMTFGAIVAGQLGLSLVVDHYGVLGIPVQSVNWQRLLGIVLIVMGVILIRRF